MIWIRVNNTENKKISKNDSEKIKNIQSTVNRELGRLDVIAKEVDKQSSAITDLGVAVDGISAQIEKTTSIITEAQGVGMQRLSNLLQSKVIYLEVKPTDTDIITIQASNEILQP